MDERERPVEVERETTVINAGGERGGGGAIAAILVLLTLVMLAFLFFGGYFESAADEVGVNVNVETPDVKMPDINIDAGGEESAPANKSGE